MAIAFPFVIDNKKLVGTCFIAGTCKNKVLLATTLNHIVKGDDLSIGEDVIIAGYPYVGLGSCLETAHICNLSTKCQRMFMKSYPVDEFTVSNQTLVGSSGSPVIKRSNGKICGMVR